MYCGWIFFAPVGIPIGIPKSPWDQNWIMLIYQLVDIDYEMGGFFNIIRYTPVTTVFDVC